MVERNVFHPAAAHQRPAPLALLGQRRQLPIRRIDYQGGDIVELTPLDPVAHAELVALDLVAEALAALAVSVDPLLHFFLIEVAALTESGVALQRHARQVVDRPGSAQVRIAPGRDRMLPVGTGVGAEIRHFHCPRSLFGGNSGKVDALGARGRRGLGARRRRC